MKDLHAAPGLLRRIARPGLVAGVLCALMLTGPASSQTNQAPGLQELAAGIRLLRSGDAPHAIESFNAALKLAPNSAEAHTWRGVAENQTQQYAAAAKDFRAALCESPAMLPAHYNFALSLIRLHDTDAAIEQLNFVVAAQPGSVPALYNLALLLEAKGSFAEAAVHLDAAHALAPEDGGVSLHLLLDSLHLHDESRMPAILSSLAASSTGLDLQQQAARALLQAGRFRDAATLLRGAHALNPGSSSVTLLLARVLLAGDEAEEARAVLEQVPAEEDHKAERQTLLGAALAALHRIPEATASLQAAVAEDSQLALAQNILGFCFFQQGEYAKAAQAYGKAAELEPARLLYAEDAARADERANRMEQALQFAERAAALTGATAADHALLGKLYAASGRREDAVRELQRAASLDPNLDAPAYLLARTYMQMGNEAQAVVWSDKLAHLKEQHRAEFASQKKSAAESIRSSTLLQGGTMNADPASSQE